MGRELRQLFQLAIVLSFLVCGSPVVAADLATFSPGSPIRSADINANFSELENRNNVLRANVDSLDARVQTLETGGCSASSSPAKLVVFSTSSTYLGNAGRKALNAACSALDARASFCAASRINNAIETTGVDFSGLTSTARTESAGSGLANCYSWTSTSDGTYADGYGITATGGVTKVYCGSPVPLACCY